MVSTWQLPAAVVACALVAPAMAQTTETESTAIVQEVRLLRHALETLARSGVGAQIASQRLQIFEQRRLAAFNELTDVTREHAMITGAIESAGSQIKNVEDRMLHDPDPKRRAESTDQLEYLKQHLESLESRLPKLARELADAEQRLALAQADWDALSQKLDHLERVVSGQR